MNALMSLFTACMLTLLLGLTPPSSAYAKAASARPACAPGAKLDTGKEACVVDAHPAPPPKPATGLASCKTEKTRPPAPVYYNTILAWCMIAGITIVGMLVGMYPIAYYIGAVWKSRQKLIFETLSIDAKRMYLQLYRSAEAMSLATDALVNDAFSKVYNHWFGRGRLLAPTWFIGLIEFPYIFLGAMNATQALLPSPKWVAPFTLQSIALAAMTGAYILVTMDTIRRVVRRDLLPEDLQLTALRLAACVPLGYAFSSLVPDDQKPFIALAMTAIPLQQVADFLTQLAGKRTGMDIPAAAASPTLMDSPSQLSGVDRSVCERLSAIGVNTITQIAYSDPVQLTMRTSMSFIFILDVVSQALAWVYIEDRLNGLRKMGLRGAFELAALKGDAEHGNVNALVVMDQLPAILGLSAQQCANMLHQMTDDPYVQFLLTAYA